MQHPYYTKSVKINAILDMCTTYWGIPYGPALIHYDDPNNKSYSFKGICIFIKGEIHLNPFMCINGNGIKYLYTSLINGRPYDGALTACFSEDGYK